MAAPAQVTTRAVDALLHRYLGSTDSRRLVLVHGSYRGTVPAEFTTGAAGMRRRVRVCDQSSVLGILQAWQEHQDTAGPHDLLVVTTRLPDEQIGYDLLGHAVRRSVLLVEQAEIVKQRFAATALDPRIHHEQWLLDALVDAEPAEGWPRIGAVLTRDEAVRALLAARLLPGGPLRTGAQVTVDTDSLLAWTRTEDGPRRFTGLPDRERAPLREWLGQTAGPAAQVLVSLVEAGQGADAMALGLLGSALRDPGAGPDTALAVGALYGSVRPSRADLEAFTEAVEGTLTRWIGEALSGGEPRKQRVWSVLDRADAIAGEAGLTPALRGNRFLGSAFTAQLRRVTTAAARRTTAEAESALADLAGHALAPLSADRVAVAENAVRTARWLSLPRPRIASVGAGVRAHLADHGWIDRALAVLWAGDPAGDSLTGQDLRELYEAAWQRRAVLDEEFADRLVHWVPHATAGHPDGALLVENVLDEMVRPLLGRPGADPPPLVLVLDGMSAAVAAGIGEDTERDGWTEAVPAPAPGGRPGRQAAVAMFPSTTVASRASLLSGTAARGGQSAETDGFTAYFTRRGRQSRLFHKASIGGAAGHYLAEEISMALASDDVVGVVLNTIDDALDKGQEGRRTGWSTREITYLPELLSAARSYGRPVVLVADHGHILERGHIPQRGRTSPPAAPPSRQGPPGTEPPGAARWRSGEPGDGEILLSGPRVLEGGGTIVAPWSEDIRYTGRRAGYHGGASLAEVTVPVLVLLPSRQALPKGWTVLPREQAAPGWWRTAATLAEPVPADGPRTTTPSAGRSRRAPASARGSLADGRDTLFTPAEAAALSPGSGTAAAAGRPGSRPGGGRAPEAELPAAPAMPATLGARVVASAVYQAQKEFVRKAPEAKVVAAAIDALAEAGGTLSPAALAAAVSATGRVRRNIDGFVVTAQRLLNVEGYPVLGLVDSGHTVKLDIDLMRGQFALEDQR